MKKFLLILVSALAVVVALHFTLSRRAQNVILITLDTTRADFIGSYNSQRTYSPNMDRIANEGVVFKNAYTLIPITFPAHSSMMTSHSPYKLGAFNNRERLQTKLPVLADILQHNGYKTGAFVSLAVLGKKYGLGKGFQHYAENFGRISQYYGVAEDVNATAIPWLEAHQKEKFFAWIHYSDPHDPYLTPDKPPDTQLWINDQFVKEFSAGKGEHVVQEFLAQPGKNQVEFRSNANIDPNVYGKTYIHRIEFDQKEGIQVQYGEEWHNGRIQGYPGESTGRAIVTVLNTTQKPISLHVRFFGAILPALSTLPQRYGEEVLYMDHFIGALWEDLGKWGIRDRTIVILVGDHGESLGEHDRIGHIYPLTQQLLHVPLIIYYPGLGMHDKSVSVLANHLDIMPTILDLLRLSFPQSMEGHSLKRYVSRSPLDQLFAPKVQRAVTFSSTYQPEAVANSFALLNGNYKLIETNRNGTWEREAYDLSKDPLELHNLFQKTNNTKAKEVATLQTLLNQFSGEAQAIYGGHKAPAPDKETEEMLRALGYVTH